ncbi:hypothetical protein [Planococcus sp. ISL-110]|uniref:hypothetical protein n=1 Tax=Planococcus sp. ISL-110 TaxID=2819167 RepID=UPI001BEC74BD|nr:hypothetical protein [Planococcus sp. ISL-110]MBT2570583.1 hypothetical protein [Planococcus sp. ISL-110]
MNGPGESMAKFCRVIARMKIFFIYKKPIGGADGKHGMEDFLVTQVVYIQYKNEK